VPNHWIVAFKADVEMGKTILRCANNLCNYTIRFKCRHGETPKLELWANALHHFDECERLAEDAFLENTGDVSMSPH
jgi:hypothetical protein